MGLSRLVSTDFWTDEKVVELFSVEDCYFFLYLLTNPHSSPLGVYKLTLKQAAFECKWTVDQVAILLNRFEEKYNVVKWSASTSEIAIKNYMLYGINSGGKPLNDRLKKDIDAVKNKELLEFVYDGLAGKHVANASVKSAIEYIGEKISPPSAPQPPLALPTSTPYPPCTKGLLNTNGLLSTYDGDRDSESYHDSSNPAFNPENKGGAQSGVQLKRSDNKKSASKPAIHPKKGGKKFETVKHKYGEYKNVLLTDKDMEKLKSEFPDDYEKRIESLSAYMASTGKSYKNHLATIRNWARRDKERETNRPRYGEKKGKTSDFVGGDLDW